jgi:hypothetical protein
MSRTQDVTVPIGRSGAIKMCGADLFLPVSACADALPMYTMPAAAAMQPTEPTPAVTPKHPAVTAAASSGRSGIDGRGAYRRALLSQVGGATTSVIHNRHG